MLLFLIVHAVAVAQRFMPDVVSSASLDQLRGSEDYVVIVLAILGEMNTANSFKLMPPEQRPTDCTANCMLHYELDEGDNQLWDVMDQNGTFSPCS